MCMCICVALVISFLFQGAGAKQLRGSTKVNIRAPLNDRRSYEYTTFDNGLKVLAVEDPKASKSGFAVAVSAGSYYDPVEVPGLAHFCEHLLFLGTKKYPDEASFDTFLSMHDGSNNAFTEQERTVFYNEISHAGFEEGMDRFAQFFISPLFKQELVGRELQAVNSEHLKNVPDQGRRLWELMRSLARNGSVVQRFYTGTIDSLHHGDNKTVTALKKYHSENYCGPRMTLVMTSNISLSKQLEVAHAKFDSVPRGDGHCSPTPHDFADQEPFGVAENLNRLIQMGTDSVPQLWMMWPLPPTLRDYRAQPAEMIEYELGYAGPKSLKSHLKSAGLISNLGTQVDQSSATSLIFVTFDLTKDGEENVENITAIVFKYLKKLRAQKDADVNAKYKTMQQMSFVTFDYQEAPDSVQDFVSTAAGNLLAFEPSDVLAGDTTIDTIDSPLLQRLLAKMSPENVNLALASKQFNEKDSNRQNQYYRVKYQESAIPETWRKSWDQNVAGDEMHSPPALKYVPSNLALRSETAGKVPLQLNQSEGVELWWLGKGLFPLPKAQLRVKLTCAKQLFGTPELAAMRLLHSEMTKAGLEEPMEDLGMCGLNWEFSDSAEGYHLSMDGYNEHIAALVSQVAGGVYLPSDDPARFNQAKQKLIVALEDTTSKMPYEHAMQSLSVVSTNSVFSRTDRIAALKAISLSDFKSYLADVKAHGFRIQLLVTGNTNADGTRHLARTLVAGLGTPKLLRKEEAAGSKALRFSSNVEVRIRNPIPNDSNNAVVNAYQFGVPSVADRVKLLMIGKMLSQPAYDELRTKQQLGYVVFAVMFPHLRTLELVMIVQGAKKAPDDIDARIEDVLDNFAHTLRSLTASEFKNWKASLRSTINVKDQNMGQEADRIWKQIADDEYCFNRRESALAYLDSFETPLDLAAEFARMREKPSKVSIRLFGANMPVNQTQTNVMVKVHNTTSLVSAQSTVVVYNDGSADKATVAKGQDYWPASRSC